MDFQKQDGRNLGTISKLYISDYSNYSAIAAAVAAADGVVTDAIIADYFSKVDFEFEKGSWEQDQIESVHGDYWERMVNFTLRKYNSAVRAFIGHWWYRKVLAYVVDFQGNTLLIGSDSEFLKFKGSKPSEISVTTGASAVIKLYGLSRREL